MPLPSRPLSHLSNAWNRKPLVSALVALLFAQLARYAYADYRLYLSLGGGGPLPHNWLGWLVHLVFLQPLALDRHWRTGGSYLPSSLPNDEDGYLHDGLEKRTGPRPRTAGVAPHRQIEGLEAEGYDRHLQGYLLSLAASHPSHLLCTRSRIEPASTALLSLTHTLVTCSSKPSRSTRSAAFPSALARQFVASMSGGEFCHVHSSSASTASPSDRASIERQRDGKTGDASLHLILHPRDAIEVVEKGWGELHGLAGCPSHVGFWIGWPAFLARRTGRLGRWWPSWNWWGTEGQRGQRTGVGVGLPPTYTLVYAPRDEREAEGVKRIVRASVGFATGLDEV